MRNMSLMKMEQDFHVEFRWWHYDKQTREVVIAFNKDGNWRPIRIYDMIWIVNMSGKDIEMMFYNKVYYVVEDIVHMM
ncbi:hypothetical protein Hanom_Chr16g01509671 [Helianthus anomalus]